jgi:hypothetical protein
MATNSNSEIPMNLHPPGVDQIDGVRKVTRAFEDHIYARMDDQTKNNWVPPQAK